MWINGFCFLGQHTDTNEKSEIEINDEDYAAFARNSLSVNVIPSRKLSRELPPSGQGANFILNHMEREKSYKGRVSKNDFNWKKQDPLSCSTRLIYYFNHQGSPCKN